MFYNNTVSNSYLQNSLPWDVRIWGDDATVENSIFENGTGGFIFHGDRYTIDSNVFKDYYDRGGQAALTFGNGSTNGTLSNNIFTNLSSVHALRLHTADDNLITNNTFLKVYYREFPEEYKLDFGERPPKWKNF